MRRFKSKFLSVRRSRHLVMALFFAALWVTVGAKTYAGLLITPTFDSTITSDPNAASIENTINQAINIYQSKFTDPINVTIKFQSMTSGLGSSNTYLYKIGYQQFINQLTADKTTADDNTALAHLPSGAINPVTGSTTINVKTANLRAIGITGLNSGLPGGYDGIIGLNTHITDIGSPGTTGQYSLLATTEHEIDEVLGLGSDLPGGGFFSDPAPEDLFRYTATGARTFITTGDNAYFSIDGVTNLARFNQGNNAGGDYGDWWSNNGGGNPGPFPPPQVQDAFAYPGNHPPLGVELRSLDVIGYNLVPEPSSFLLAACAVLGFVAVSRTKRRPAEVS